MTSSILLEKKEEKWGVKVKYSEMDRETEH